MVTGADADKLTEVMTVGRQVPRALRGEFLQRFAELPRDRADPGDDWARTHLRRA
jgi:hypothetical protein